MPIYEAKRENVPAMISFSISTGGKMKKALAIFTLILVTSVCLVLAGCGPMGNQITKNGVPVVMKHDDFKGITTYNSMHVEVDVPFQLIGGYKINMFIYRFETDADKTARDYVEITLFGQSWCFVGDKDELNFLASGDKFSLYATGESSRNVITGDLISETAMYPLTEKGKEYFSKHTNTPIRIQLNGSKCNQEGTVTAEGTATLTNFIHAFEGGTITPDATPVPAIQKHK